MRNLYSYKTRINPLCQGKGGGGGWWWCGKEDQLQLWGVVSTLRKLSDSCRRFKRYIWKKGYIFFIYPPEQIEQSEWDIKYIMYIAFSLSRRRKNAEIKRIYYCIYPSKKPYIHYIYFQTIHKAWYFSPPMEKRSNYF